MVLYHATFKRRLPQIIKYGLDSKHAKIGKTVKKAMYTLHKIMIQLTIFVKRLKMFRMKTMILEQQFQQLMQRL